MLPDLGALRASASSPYSLASPWLSLGPGVAMKRPPPTILDVLDLVAPWLAQEGRCRVQATCSALRKAAIRSEEVNHTVTAGIDSVGERRSFLVWLKPRAHAVKYLSYSKS